MENVVDSTQLDRTPIREINSIARLMVDFSWEFMVPYNAKTELWYILSIIDRITMRF